MFLQPPTAGQVNVTQIKERQLKTRRRREKKTKKQSNFLTSWTEKFPWVRHEKEKDEMFCFTCREFQTSADM